jgi:hypothetical protein
MIAADRAQRRRIFMQHNRRRKREFSSMLFSPTISLERVISQTSSLIDFVRICLGRYVIVFSSRHLLGSVGVV